jgi:hypothetical protein
VLVQLIGGAIRFEVDQNADFLRIFQGAMESVKPADEEGSGNAIKETCITRRQRAKKRSRNNLPVSFVGKAGSNDIAVACSFMRVRHSNNEDCEIVAFSTRGSVLTGPA